MEKQREIIQTKRGSGERDHLDSGNLKRKNPERDKTYKQKERETRARKRREITENYRKLKEIETWREGTRREKTRRKGIF